MQINWNNMQMPILYITCMERLLRIINNNFKPFHYVGVPAVLKELTILSLAALSTAKTLSQQPPSVPPLLHL